MDVNGVGCFLGKRVWLRRRLLAGLALTSVSLAAHGAATAQEAAPASSSVITLDPITVTTARKRDEDPKNVPFGLDIYTRQNLDDRRATTFADVLRDSSSVNLTDYGDKRSSVVTIRGVGPLSGAPGNVDDTSVLTFVDGVPQPLYGSDAQMLDLERVEVLKGPQSTLFGRNTSGGAISIIPRAPSFAREATVRGELGSDFHRRFEAIAGGTIVPDVLAGRIALRYSGVNGYIPNLYGGALGGDDSFAGRMGLLWKPTDRTNVTLTLSGERDRLKPSFFTYLESPSYPLAAVTRSDLGRTLWGTTLKIDHEFDAFRLTSTTAATSVDLKLDTDDTDGLLWSRLTGLPPSALTTGNDFSDWRERETKLYQEVRLSSLPNAPIAWVTGISLYNDKFDLRYNNSHTFVPSLNGVQQNDFTTRGAGVFGEVTYPVFDRLKLTLGGRLSHESKEYHSAFTSNGFPGVVPSSIAGDRMQFNFWTGRASLLYEWTNELSTYATIGRGYKTGGFPRFRNDAYQGLPSLPYKSATSLTYEIGAKARTSDGRGRANVAFFWNDVHDEQLFALDFTTFIYKVYNGDTRSYGFEFDAAYEISRGLELSGGFTILHGETRNLSPDLISLVQGLANGNRLVQAPEFAGNAAVTYRTTQGSIGADGNLMARLSYNYVGARFADIGNLAPLNAYHLVNGRIGIENPRGEFYLFARNLLDQDYNLNSVYYQPGVHTALPARGRVIGVGASAKF
jgi:iron complex outermembrane receptor protein